MRISDWSSDVCSSDLPAERPMSAPDDTGAGSLLDHLVELRSRLLRGIVGVVVALLALLPFTSQLYTWLALPLVSRLPAGQQMIALNPAGAFFAPIKLAFFVAVFAAAPWPIGR